MGNCLKPERHWADHEEEGENLEEEEDRREIMTTTTRMKIVITKKELRVLAQLQQGGDMRGSPAMEGHHRSWKPSLKSLQEVCE